jgi:hypothetical protein
MMTPNIQRARVAGMMQNYIVDIHGRFDHPLDIPASVLDSGNSSGDTVAVMGFYASRQMQAPSPSHLVERVIKDVKDEICSLIPSLLIDDVLSLEVDGIDAVSTDFRAANRGFTFYAND